MLWTTRNAAVLFTAMACWTGLFAEISFELPKGDKRYPDYPIPEAEKSFTTDSSGIRRVTLPGERLSKPIVVTPHESTSLDSPWVILARYLQIATSGSLEKILPLYDEPSQRAIRKMPTADLAKLPELISRIERYEFWLLIYRDDYFIAYGYLVTQEKRDPTHVTFRKYGNEYRMIAGVPPYSAAYGNAFTNLLADKGFNVVSGTAVDSPTRL